MGAIEIGDTPPPRRPARPERPQLLPPKMMPRRRNFGSPTGRIALLHAIAHIEVNALDLGWDIVARFRGERLPREFFADWAGVAADEARHFEWLSARLADLGRRYGDLPAHDGLWEAAAATAHDLIARLAVVPLVLEARGLDADITAAGGCVLRWYRRLIEEPARRAARRAAETRGESAR